MNKEEIAERVAVIERATWDFDGAHRLEDSLYLDFIKHVASQNGPYSAMAKQILKTQDLTFSRYCA